MALAARSQIYTRVLYESCWKVVQSSCVCVTTTGSVFFAITRAWAMTLAKAQGTTLEHITIMADVTGVPGAGYVAYSRVRSVNDIMFLTYPRASFFTPSRG